MGKKLTYDEFVKRSNIIHNNKYEYNEGKYVKYGTVVILNIFFLLNKTIYI